jgi:LPXTG-site transpeptidase (sortase) family protein
VTVNFSSNPALTLTKTANPTSVSAAGDIVTYTFSVQNTGNVTLTNITLSDSLLSGLSCTAIASLAPGASQSFTCTGNTYTVLQSDIDNNGGGDGDIDNTATATGTPPSGPDVSDTDSQAVTITRTPALTIIKEVSADNTNWNDTSVTVVVGDTVFYRVRVSNTGNITLTGLVVNDLTIACTLVRGADITGDNDNNFEVGEEWAYTCSVTAVLGTVNNTATADTNETPLASDTASYTAVSALVIDPALSKAGNPTEASVGETVTFTLTITNNGNAPVPNVVVTDVLPAIFDVTAVNVTANDPLFSTSTSITPLGGPAPYTVVVTFNDPLDVNDVVTIQIVTRVNSQGNPPIVNTASLMTSAQGDPTFNNSDSVTITIRTPRVKLPETGFAPDVVTTLPAQPSTMQYASTDVLLEIPSLGLKMPVVGVSKKNGTWDVSWLGRQAGWLEESAFPSWKGNSVLTSHVYGANGLPGPFVDLNKLKYGDKVIIHAYGQKYIFEVRANEIIGPNDVSSVMKHEERSWLTLVTCKEYDEKTKTYKKRLMVRAVLVKVEWDR